MSVLVHWVPTFAAGLILAIAGFVLDWRIRAERRARCAGPRASGAETDESPGPG